MNFRKIFFGVYFLLLGFSVGLTILNGISNGQKPIDIKSLTGLYSPDEKIGIFHGLKITANYVPLLTFNFNNRNVLGLNNLNNKRLEVDLTNQRIYAFDGNDKVFDFLISSGKWGRTPTGEFTIWGKFRYVHMVGGNPLIGTYYNLPNVPYVMFFYNQEIAKDRGFSIHGTYWHSNFGHPMSHGCVNMKTEEAEKLYYWANPDLSDNQSILTSTGNPGTRVIVYGTAPDD
jgi:hypothetical protein